MIPDYYDGHFLPDGDHEATWAEVQERFGRGPRRQRLCEQMRQFLVASRSCGFRAVYLFGSFISAKEEPGDIDLLLVYKAELLDSLSGGCQELINHEKIKARWNWDLFCCGDAPGTPDFMLSAFRKDRTREKHRGIIRIDLEKLEAIVI